MRIELTEDRVRIGVRDVRDGGGAEREVFYNEIDSVEVDAARHGALVIVRHGGQRDVITPQVTSHDVRALAAEIGAIVDGYAALIADVAHPGDLARIVEELDDRPGFLATGFVPFLLWATVRLGASELQLAPSRLGTMLRVRIDGVMHIAGAVSATRGRRIAAHLKGLAGLRPHRSDIPQAGRLSVVCGRSLETFRASFLPTRDGERAEIRVFDRVKSSIAPDELGFDPRGVARLRRATRASAGVVVVSAPVSSGKTTTAYALARELAGERGGNASIASVEDAIEADLTGVVQHEGQLHGRSVRDLLHTVLREPVDVVLVDEIHSRETAQVAFDAGNGGRLVLATLRADSAAHAVVQLLDYGVRPAALTAALRAVSCQRLLHPPDEQRHAQRDAQRHAERHAHGRRTAVGEVLVADDVVREVIERRGSAAAIEASGRAAGMTPLRTGAARLVAAGLASESEVARVLPRATS